MLVYFFSSLQFLLYCVIVFFKISLFPFVLSYAVFFELFYGLLFIPCFFMYNMAYVLMFSPWNFRSVCQHSTAVPQSPYYSHYLITRSTDNAATCYSCPNVSGKYTFRVCI